MQEKLTWLLERNAMKTPASVPSSFPFLCLLNDNWAPGTKLVVKCGRESNILPYNAMTRDEACNELRTLIYFAVVVAIIQVALLFDLISCCISSSGL